MLLNECSCGEPLIDDARRCPQCGKPNPGYRQSRWRIFWPDVDSVAGADEAITLGYTAAFAVAIVTAVLSLIPGLGSAAGLVDAAIYGLLGLGIQRKWRTAAVAAFLLFVAGVVFSVASGQGVGILAAFVFVGLVNGVRGTMVRAKLSRITSPETAA
jgi:hypothetical protein